MDDFCISDSAVICDYLENSYQAGNALYPENKEERARALWFEKYADTVMTEVVYRGIFFEQVVKPHVLQIAPEMEKVTHNISHALPPLLSYLDEAVSQNDYIAGAFFLWEILR